MQVIMAVLVGLIPVDRLGRLTRGSCDRSTTLGLTATAVLAACRAKQTVTEGRCSPGS